MFNAIKKIHFVGIGGSGMSGIAEVLLNSGYKISGSDIKKSAIIEKLEELGAKIFIGHQPENVKNAQVLVISSAINKHNPEIIEAQNLRIPIIHRSEMLAELMRMKYGVIVAGTHGKTTTTSILASSLHNAGLDPTVVIGGKLNSFGSNAKLGKGDLFVAEADESDGSFLKLTPTIAIITNIDKDHLDHYASLDDIVKAFEAFIEKVPFYGAVCACIDDPIVQMVLPKIRRKIVTYGLRQDADISAIDKFTDGINTTYTPVIYGKPQHQVTIKMPGLYNLTNSLATFAVASLLDLNMNLICKSISEFEGVQHRFSILADINNILIVDDYAHNPKKIETVLKGTKESFPDKQIIAIFQPHRYSRIKFQMEEFAKCFIDADKVIVTPIYAAGESPINGINKENIAHQIKLKSFNNTPGTTYVVESLEEASESALNILIHATPAKGAIVITLGAGNVRQAGHMILEKLNLEWK
ncbi:UDP-N-acetylmuramate--L-alanine ligase [Fluviispira multicolorata]|uniref:UDP-N-acetylmuramate--L-alanine ligase n=1 Tax=Fluviispira multicolorata TaxID=2654512 RepID=A0A833N3Z5_9BACT|nr:UDP-N-acetylmuramate--L-alanine ligase [Fluviispira multicolorata]KAB8030874.1 UDP-N-acetylmuramate--L-alanine ligase [Fluviispira multicolorata]